MRADHYVHLTDLQEELLLSLAGEVARGTSLGPVRVTNLVALVERSEQDCWTLLRELYHSGCVVVHDAGPGRSLSNAASLTDLGKNVAFDRALIEGRGRTDEFSDGLSPLQLTIVDVVTEQESRAGGASLTRGQVRVAVRNLFQPLSLSAINEAISGLAERHLQVGTDAGSPARVTTLGLFASKWGTNAVEIIDGLFSFLRATQRADPALRQYSWGQVRRGLGLPRKAHDLFYVTVTRCGMGKGIFRHSGDDWWSVPDNLDEILEEPSALSFLRKSVPTRVVESATPAGAVLNPSADAGLEERITMPTHSIDPKKVFIIHGRNIDARTQVGIFLRSLGLEPINFDELRASLRGTPTIADIVTEGMKRAQGIVALFTPDEYAALRPGLTEKDETGESVERWQARPNVLFEAGMAFGQDRDRVVLVKLGRVNLFTDVGGIHVLSPTNDPKGHRDTLRKTLKEMGCSVNLESSDWMHEGDFEACIKGLPEVSTRRPFAEPARAPADARTALPAFIESGHVVPVARDKTMPYGELLLAAQSVKNMLAARAVGKGADDREFQDLRQRLLDYPSVKSTVPECLLTCRSLDEFWAFIQPKFKTYAERKDYLRKEFEPLLTMLEIQKSGAA